MSLILGQLVAHWLLLGVEKKGSTQKEGSKMTTLIFGKFQFWGTPKQSSLTFAFVDHVIDRREIEEGKVDIQFGIDDGGDVVKLRSSGFILRRFEVRQ